MPFFSETWEDEIDRKKNERERKRERKMKEKESGK